MLVSSQFKTLLKRLIPNFAAGLSTALISRKRPSVACIWLFILFLYRLFPAFFELLF